MRILRSGRCAPGALVAAAILVQWPDPALDPARQCQGRYTTSALEEYLAEAQLARWLPSTRDLAIDQSRGCVRITVASVGTGRLVELMLLRGMTIPRGALAIELQ